MDSSLCYSKFPSKLHQLEDIKEDSPTSASASWVPAAVRCAPPETPTESMEFLARSWSLSSMELSKALTNTLLHSNVLQSVPFCSTGVTVHDIDSTTSFSADNNNVAMESELLLLHRALDPDFLTNQQLLKNGLYRSVLRGKMVGRWLKDQKEKKKQETRTQNAQLYAAVSVAGVAAAVAAIAAATAISSETAASKDDGSSKTSAAVASAAALVASHCVEVAEEMGADHNQIITAIKSAVNIKTNGDMMALTAGAATALRGAATLRARLKGYQNAAFASTKEQVEEGKELDTSSALNFVYRGGELLKRTRKGDLHWKQVSFYINSDGQVIAKMKSKYMVGTFTKKKKCVVSDVECEIPSWPGRERDESGEQRSYFGIRTADRWNKYCKHPTLLELMKEAVRILQVTTLTRDQAA
ncbi:protein of unknown function DUF828 [Macleaya cordata]|uniref:VAN3-binding protein n=1 Tax=Macleaya cordata TaxID=56857 RepID=A0A200RC74_MACCD|nr:protein of unknown function DUF828 [Macleaya cordata]